MLTLLNKRAAHYIDNPSFPDWVSDKNVTLVAYTYINKIKQDRLEYISMCNRKIDFKKKGTYQITASEIARHTGVQPSTLITSSSYSEELASYLSKVNEELELAKNKKLETHKRTRSAGRKQRTKPEIVKELQETREELKLLKEKNALEQVELLLEQLPLPIKRKLGLDV